MCINVDSLQNMCAEVRHKFNCIFIFSQVFMLTNVEYWQVSCIKIHRSVVLAPSGATLFMVLCMGLLCHMGFKFKCSSI
jgi:hypothetical protein